MGVSIDSDICENFLELDHQIPNFIGDDSHGERFGKWLCVGSAAECGENQELYGYVFIETEQSYSDLEKQYTDDNYDKIWESHPMIYLVHRDDYDEFGVIFSHNRSAVEKFKQDFNYKGDIENVKSVTQII